MCLTPTMHDHAGMSQKSYMKDTTLVMISAISQRNKMRLHGIRNQSKVALLWMKGKSSNSDILLHRGSKIYERYKNQYQHSAEPQQ